MHFGNDLKSSLKDYGMVCRKEKSDQYFFIYKVEDKFEEGFISESDLSDFMKGQSGYSKKEIKKFLDKNEFNLKEFMNSSILNRVYQLSEHFGIEVILGKAVAGLTLATALDILEKE